METIVINHELKDVTPTTENITPTFSAQPYVIYEGDALDIISRLDCKIDCVVTSPPYCKQRKYGTSNEEMGREATPDEFITSLVDIFIALKPKLNPWASVWVNLGDKRGPKRDLLAVPELFVIAMRKAGFPLADKVVWMKEAVPVDGKALGHCMIEPANWRLNGHGWEPLYRFVLDTDAAWEPLFRFVLNTKVAWSDTCAVCIPRDKHRFFDKETMQKIEQNPYEHQMECVTSLEGRRLTNVWHVGSSRKGKGEFFAAFPAALVERPIAMTCPEFIVMKDGIRTPRVRQREQVEYSEGPGKSKRFIGQYSHVEPAPDEDTLTEEQKTVLAEYRAKSGRNDTARPYIPHYDKTIGWSHPDLPAEPGVVLDPFCGTGTTGAVALKLGRRFIGIDLYAENVELSNKRCYDALYPQEKEKRVKGKQTKKGSQMQIQDQSGTSEATSQVPERNPSDCETPVVIAQSLLVAQKFHTMIAFFEVNKVWIIELRKRFGVSQGQAGHMLTIEGNNVYWKEFVTNYFHVIVRWMNELLQIKEKPESNPKPDEEKPLYQRGFQAGRESVEGVAEIDRGIEGYKTKVAELEKEIADLKQHLKAAKTLAYRNMLVKLIEAVEKVAEGLLPVSLTRLADNLRDQMNKLDEPTTAVPQKLGVIPKKEPQQTTSWSGSLSATEQSIVHTQCMK